MEKKGFDQKLASWLRGRNGTDELSTCVIVVAFILVVVNIFVRSLVLTIISGVLIVYALFRMTSKNLEARENENGVFTEFIGPVRPWLRNPAQAMGEARAYKHLKCPECGQRVRVPRGKGKIRVRCPQCNMKFDARS
ncbi:MAG: hypothetical protein IKF78_00695 [Atopobiaceae bacterium]|nr:hypothetical protein [Atopobiaceae bacterium]